MKILFRNSFLLAILFLVYCNSLFAQTDSVTPPVKTSRPVLDPWSNSLIIDNQTSYIPAKGGIEFVIHHRFKSISDGISDLYGFYGASNIRLGLSYSVTNNLMMGFGTEKDEKYQEFFLKYKILEQSRDNSMPLSVLVFANTCISGNEKAYWGNDYSFTDRLSYFSQIIVSRKWTDRFSSLVTFSYAHINKVDSYRVETEDSLSITTSYYPKFYNDALGVSAAGRFKINGTFTVIAEFEQGIPIAEKSHNGQHQHNRAPEPLSPKPNVALGFEITTMTHAFQLFASSYRGIIPQDNLLTNTFDFTKKEGIMLGFNIVVKF